MKSPHRAFLFALLTSTIFPACADCGGEPDDVDASVARDSGQPAVDASTPDSAATDSARADSARADSVAPDSAAADSAAADSTTLDSAAADSAAADSAAPGDSSSAYDASLTTDAQTGSDLAAGTDAASALDAAGGDSAQTPDSAVLDVATSDAAPTTDAAGPCVLPCQGDGMFRCADAELLQRCTLGNDGCLRWEDSVDCGDSSELCFVAGAYGTCVSAGLACFEYAISDPDDCDLQDKSDDLCELKSFDDQGHLVETRQDPDCDGLPPYVNCQLNSWDLQGRLVSEGVDQDCDGEADVGCGTYTYVTGNLVDTFKLDEECDDSSTECERYTYDAGGNRSLVEIDTDCDDAVDATMAYTFDAKGNVLTSETIRGSGSTSCITRTYDGLGRPTSLRLDGTCDGSDDSCYTWERFSISGRGLVVQQEQSDCGGGSRICRNQLFNVRGTLLLEEAVDTGCDASDDRACKQHYYDSDGRVVRSVIDDDCDDVAERCDETVWSSAGLALLEYSRASCAEETMGACGLHSYKGDCGLLGGEGCSSQHELAVDGSHSFNSSNGTSRHDRNSCVAWPTRGKEVIYRLFAPAEDCAGTWELSASLGGLTTDLDLFLLGSCDPGRCLDYSAAAGSAAESITWLAMPGESFYLMVDAAGLNTSTYQLGLSATCTNIPQTSCVDACGEFMPEAGGCSCASNCFWTQDCCPDFCSACPEKCYWQGEECGGVPPWGCCDGNTHKKCSTAFSIPIERQVVVEDCSSSCGWGEEEVCHQAMELSGVGLISTAAEHEVCSTKERYGCDGSGADPGGRFPQACP